MQLVQETHKRFLFTGHADGKYRVWCVDDSSSGGGIDGNGDVEDWSSGSNNCRLLSVYSRCGTAPSTAQVGLVAD
jgi:hypothetical protein